ncbi:helix-turn-helix transcriptional regulator [Methylocystis sp.]|uniref:helix-turn-helix transcriptional regulator n=1 Tax=Methylocystis sp. TaxID=1911079 RepID=UPI003D1304CC
MTNHTEADTVRAHRVKQFCERVGISASTFWKYVRQEKIRTIRIGGRVLVPHAEALRILSEGVGGREGR